MPRVDTLHCVDHSSADGHQVSVVFIAQFPLGKQT